MLFKETFPTTKKSIWFFQCQKELKNNMGDVALKPNHPFLVASIKAVFLLYVSLELGDNLFSK